MRAARWLSAADEVKGFTTEAGLLKLITESHSEWNVQRIHGTCHSYETFKLVEQILLRSTLSPQAISLRSFSVAGRKSYEKLLTRWKQWTAIIEKASGQGSSIVPSLQFQCSRILYSSAIVPKDSPIFHLILPPRYVPIYPSLDLVEEALFSTSVGLVTLSLEVNSEAVRFDDTKRHDCIKFIVESGSIETLKKLNREFFRPIWGIRLTPGEGFALEDSAKYIHILYSTAEFVKDEEMDSTDEVPLKIELRVSIHESMDRTDWKSYREELLSKFQTSLHYILDSASSEDRQNIFLVSHIHLAGCKALERICQEHDLQTSEEPRYSFWNSWHFNGIRRTRRALKSYDPPTSAARLLEIVTNWRAFEALRTGNPADIEECWMELVGRKDGDAVELKIGRQGQDPRLEIVWLNKHQTEAEQKAKWKYWLPGLEEKWFRPLPNVFHGL